MVFNDYIDNYPPDILNKLELNIQECMLLRNMISFYKNKEYYDILVSIINGENKISKRTIEFLVTKYSNPKNNFVSSQECINIYSSYKNQLKIYKKKNFDPFGRGDRIPFFIHNDCVITTIGQLNFYKWFIEKKIYNYCYNNYNDIQSSLLNNNCKSENIKSKNNFRREIYYKKDDKPFSVTFGI
jgi:hypothetical protein